MRSFFIKVKKFFSFLFSFFFGIFFKKEEYFNHSSKILDEDLDLLDSHVKEKRKQINSLEESNSTKSKSSILYLREDFKKLYMIIQKISKIEVQLKTETDEFALEEMKKDVDFIKQEMKFLENKYVGIDLQQTEVEEFVVQLKSSKKLVDQVQKKIESKTLLSNNSNLARKEVTKKTEVESKKLKESIKKKEKKESTKENFTSKKIPIVSKNSKPDLNENDQNKKTIFKESKYKKDDFSKEPSIDHYDNLKRESIILSSIIIKDDLDNLKEAKIDDQKESYQSTLKEVEDKKTTQRKKVLKESLSKKIVIKKIYPKKIKISSKSRVRKCSLSLAPLKAKISHLKSYSNMQKISSSVKKSCHLTRHISLLMMSKKVSPDILASSLLQNQHIRKARSIYNKKVRPLNYKMMLKTVFRNVILDDQVDYVVMDTISQIQKLKVELYANYGLTEEVKQLLTELDMMEIEIKNNLNQENQNTSENQRIR